MVVESLDIQIQTSAKETCDAIDVLSQKLDNVIKSLSGFSSANKSFKNISDSIQSIGTGLLKTSVNAEQMNKKVLLSADEIAKKYENLGKSFQFTGTSKTLEKQIEKYSNSLEAAKLKKEELEASGKTGGLAYEDAIRNVQKYSNVLDGVSI